MVLLKYKDKINDELNQLNKKSHIFSFIRLILAFCLIVFIVCLITLDNYLLYGLISGILLLVFILFMIFTNPIYHKIKTVKNLQLIYQKHENRRNLKYETFSPDGKEYIDYSDYKQLDLDILGKSSLYHYLCCAKSKQGRLKLAKQLTNPDSKSQKFTNCIYKIASNEESLKLEASILNINNDAKSCDNDELLSVINKKINIPKIGLLLMGISYALLLALLIVFIFNNIPFYYLSIFLILNFFISTRFGKNEIYSMPSTKYENLLSAYYQLSKDILSSDMEDEYFNELKALIKKDLENLKRMVNLFGLLSYRKNAIFSIIGNSIFYLDFIIAFIFNKNSSKIASIKDSLEAISEIELMLSLAQIGVDNEIYSIPNISNEIIIKDGYHPLVKNCVKNDFSFKGGIVLTGSNMSGKTTFMRMIGVNQILFNAGGIVCASYFSSKKLDIVTSLRANDMLQEGISTFYAEINRMKKIMQQCHNSKDTLVLVDEIFKGTNSKDRIFAASKIIEELKKLDVSFIITTHDFELCEGNVNYHFDEEYQDNKIYFDYKIKNGKCNKTNAIYLLKMSGVL